MVGGGEGGMGPAGEGGGGEVEEGWACDSDAFAWPILSNRALTCVREDSIIT